MRQRRRERANVTTVLCLCTNAQMDTVCSGLHTILCTKMHKMCAFVSYKCTREQYLYICMSICTIDPATRGKAIPKKQRDKGSSRGDARAPEPVELEPVLGRVAGPERGAQALGREAERPAAHHPENASWRSCGIGLWAFIVRTI